MASIAQAAWMAAVDAAIIQILEWAEPGRWYTSNWNDWPHSEQSAVTLCEHANLLRVEQRADGVTRYKLTPAGEAVRKNREWIRAAIIEDAEAFDRDRDAALRRLNDSTSSPNRPAPTAEMPSQTADNKLVSNRQSDTTSDTPKKIKRNDR